MCELSPTTTVCATGKQRAFIYGIAPVSDMKAASNNLSGRSCMRCATWTLWRGETLSSKVVARLKDGSSDLATSSPKLVHPKFDVIVTTTNAAARAAKAVSTRVPVVALAFGDPVGDGLVQSLA